MTSLHDNGPVPGKDASQAFQPSKLEQAIRLAKDQQRTISLILTNIEGRGVTFVTDAHMVVLNVGVIASAPACWTRRDVTRCSFTLFVSPPTHLVIGILSKKPQRLRKE